MAYPQTGSIINGAVNADGVAANRTGTGLSTQIVIKVGPNPVGAVQTLGINEDRSIAMISEVGTDGVIDSAPQSSTIISGSCKRTRFDRIRIAEAFSRGFIHVHAQRVPFDITIIDKWGGDNSDSLITTIKNVWISRINVTYSSDNFVIAEDMDWKAETIMTTLNSGNAVTGSGPRGTLFNVDSFEREADRGGRRGALDAPGLINAFLAF